MCSWNCTWNHHMLISVWLKVETFKTFTLLIKLFFRKKHFLVTFQWKISIEFLNKTVFSTNWAHGYWNEFMWSMHLGFGTYLGCWNVQKNIFSLKNNFETEKYWKLLKTFENKIFFRKMELCLLHLISFWSVEFRLNELFKVLLIEVKLFNHDDCMVKWTWIVSLKRMYLFEWDSYRWSC